MLFQIPCQSDDPDELEAYLELQLLFNMLGYKRQKSNLNFKGEKLLIDPYDENLRVRHWLSESFDDYIDYTFGSLTRTNHFTSYIKCLKQFKQDHREYHKGETTDDISTAMPSE